MKILITGMSGFIGGHLAAELENRGHEVEGYDIKDGKDILDREGVLKAMKGKDFCFHLAGMLGTHELVDNAYNGANVNIIGTLNVLDACKQTGTKLIEISKPNVWLNTYSITKQCAESFTEMYRREFGLKAVVVKWFNVYGDNQPLMEEAGYKKAIPTWIVKGLKGEPIEVYGNGEQTVDLVHTTDTVEATLSLMENFDKCEGNTFEIGAEEVVLNLVAELIKFETGGKSDIVHIPMRKGETDNTRIKSDLSKIYYFTNWKPRIPLEEGLKSTIKWYKEKYDA